MPTMRYTFPTAYAAHAAAEQAEFSSNRQGGVKKIDQGPLDVAITIDNSKDLVFWHSLFQSAGGSRVEVF